MLKTDQRSTAPPLSKLSHCKTSNVGYSISCKLCKKRGKHISYEGETGRNGFIRGKEHKRALENKNKNSILYRHVLDKHENEKDQVDFHMKITGKFTNPLSRQIDESLRIRNSLPESLLNSKAEFHGPCIKRKVLEK